jgi:phosphoglycolate phosphatase
MMLRFRHVVFDLDGTLADTGRDIANAANHVRSARGLADLSVAAVCDLVGEGARRLVARVLPDTSGAEVDDALQAFLRHYEAHLLDQTRLYPGIQALLCALNGAGVTCSVLSNKPAALCRRLVDGLGVGEYFEQVLGGDSFAARKPDPGGLQHL